MRSSLKHACILGVLLCLWLLIGDHQTATAARVSARAAVEKTEVYVGESFIFQIQIGGHDAPEEPNVSAIKAFAVQLLGGQQNSSSSVTIVNGQVTQNIRRGYIFNYRLTPKKVGNLTIPSIVVPAGGQRVRTQPVAIRALKPTETGDFKLRMELSQKKCYVGQPITLTVTWYIGKNVEGFQFGMPVLTDTRFDIADLNTKIDPNERDLYLRIPLEKGEVIGKKGRQTLDGKDYMTVRFQKILIPKKSGILKIPQGTVAFNAVVGYQNRRRSRNPFDDFFKRGRKQANYRKFVIPSNIPVLTVMDLPKSGQPKGYSGLVGKYSMVARAVPTEVSVGDPITLTIQVRGPEYVDNIELPPLHQQKALVRDFKIPEEIAPGKVEGHIKTFTQTLRAKHSNVEAIPSIELPYFDVEGGIYAVARTEPVPLTVKATRIITAKDAEGREGREEAKIEPETWTGGITHNYEDLSVLKDQAYGPNMWIRSPVWMALTGLPPLFYFILLASTAIIRRRNTDPAARQSRRAYGDLLKRLGKYRGPVLDDLPQVYASVLGAFRQYLGGKLCLAPGALTYNDVEDILRKRGVEGDVLGRLKKLFDECEASRFAGNVRDGDEPPALIDRAMTLGRDLEGSLR